MKLLTAAACLFVFCSLPGVASAGPATTPAETKSDATKKAEPKKEVEGKEKAESEAKTEKTLSQTEAKEIAEMEKRLALAIEKKDIAELEKVLREDYFDVYEGDKKAMRKRDALERCKAGQLRYLEILRDSKTSPLHEFVVVEGDAKLIPNKQDDIVPAEQWVHVRRLWKKTDGKWTLVRQIRRIEGDEGEQD